MKNHKLRFSQLKYYFFKSKEKLMSLEPILYSPVLLLVLCSCVSVNIKPKAPEKSKFYQFAEPGLPFQKIKSDPTDLAFRDPKTGHTIAVISECSESYDPKLDALEEEITSALTDSKLEKSTEMTFNERDGKRSLFSGKMDGIPVLVETLVFKKNSCAYTLTLLGRVKGFQNQQQIFQKFVESFSVE